MKNTLLITMIFVFFIFGAFAMTQNGSQAAETQLRPSQIAMQQRVQWLKAMNQDLASSNFQGVKTNALALASQGKTGAERLDGLAKELTLKMASLATAVSEAADANNSELIQSNLKAIGGVCGECHAKIRDKK